MRAETNAGLRFELNILAIESATPCLCVGLETPTGSYRRVQYLGRSHAEHLGQWIQMALGVTRMNVRDVDLIVVGTGPGSFTGIRIGIAMAKGLALSADVPLIGISTLESMAYAAAGDSRSICSVMSVAPGQSAIGVFSGPRETWERRSLDETVGDEELGSRLPHDATVVLAGLAKPHLPKEGAIRQSCPSLSALMRLGVRELTSNPQSKVMPNYLRDSSAERMHG
jgi:tRNA threonylcarbamoyladenosine biosynthesis protein TsaB